MTGTLFYTAHLDAPTLEDVQSLESDLGITLVAMEVDDDPDLAQLSPADLQRIQALEAKTGKVLIAYRQERA